MKLYINVIFLFEIQIIFYRSWDKKFFCTASRLFWPEARFEGFFGLREAVRPLEGQKIPRNGPKAKRVWTKCKTCFCPWSYKIWSVLSVKCNFFILGISLLREKDKFHHKKIPLGRLFFTFFRKIQAKKPKNSSTFWKKNRIFFKIFSERKRQIPS